MKITTDTNLIKSLIVAEGQGGGAEPHEIAAKVAARLRELDSSLTARELKSEFSVIDEETAGMLNLLRRELSSTGIFYSSATIKLARELYISAMLQKLKLLRGSAIPRETKRELVAKAKAVAIDALNTLTDSSLRGAGESARNNEMARWQKPLDDAYERATIDLDEWTDRSGYSKVKVKSLEEKKEIRTRIMKFFYDKTGGDQIIDVFGVDIAIGLHLEFDEIDPELQYLRGEDLINTSVMGRGGGWVMTHPGVREFEESLNHPDEPTEHLVSQNSVQNIFTGNVNVVHTGSGNIEIRENIQTNIDRLKVSQQEVAAAFESLIIGVEESDDIHAAKKQEILEYADALVEEALKPELQRRNAPIMTILAALAAVMTITIGGVALWDRFGPIIEGFFK